MALHGVHQPKKRVAGHGAIGVQDHHEFIGAAKPADPFGDISCLALQVPGSPSHEDLAMGSRFQSSEFSPFGQNDLFVARVAENEDVEGLRCAKTRQ